MSGGQFCQENNGNFEATCEKRDKEIGALLTYVEKAKIAHPEISETTILNLYTQRGQSTLQIQDEQAIQPSQDNKTQKNNKI